MATDSIEINASISQLDLFDEKEELYGIGARFYSNEMLSFGVGYTASSDADSLSIDLRFDLED